MWRSHGKHVRRELPPRPDLPPSAPEWTNVQMVLVVVFIFGAVGVLAWGIMSFR